MELAVAEFRSSSRPRLSHDTRATACMISICFPTSKRRHDNSWNNVEFWSRSATVAVTKTVTEESIAMIWEEEGLRQSRVDSRDRADAPIKIVRVGGGEGERGS